MAFTMSKALSYKQSDFFTGPTPPTDPYEHMYWKDTDTNTLKEYRLTIDSDSDGILDTLGWAVVTNYNEVTALLNSTVNNTTFQGIIENAAAIQTAAEYAKVPVGEEKSLLQKVAAFLKFSSDGLDVINADKTFFSRTGTTAFELYQVINEVNVKIAEFGILKAVTAPMLDVGGSPNVDSQITLGTMLLQYDAETKHITCRKG